MTLSYSLDTNVVTRLMKEPCGSTAARLARGGDDKVCTSIVVASELRFGAAKRKSARLTDAVERLLDALPVLALDAPCMLLQPSITPSVNAQNSSCSAYLEPSPGLDDLESTQFTVGAMSAPLRARARRDWRAPT